MGFLIGKNVYTAKEKHDEGFEKATQAFHGIGQGKGTASAPVGKGTGLGCVRGIEVQPTQF